MQSHSYQGKHWFAFDDQFYILVDDDHTPFEREVRTTFYASCGNLTVRENSVI
jgi:hypothetical protein